MPADFFGSARWVPAQPSHAGFRKVEKRGQQREFRAGERRGAGGACSKRAREPIAERAGETESTLNQLGVREQRRIQDLKICQVHSQQRRLVIHRTPRAH